MKHFPFIPPRSAQTEQHCSRTMPWGGPVAIGMTGQKVAELARAADQAVTKFTSDASYERFGKSFPGLPPVGILLFFSRLNQTTGWHRPTRSKAFLIDGCAVGHADRYPGRGFVSTLARLVTCRGAEVTGVYPNSLRAGKMSSAELVTGGTIIGPFCSSSRTQRKIFRQLGDTGCASRAERDGVVSGRRGWNFGSTCERPLSGHGPHLSNLS